MFKNDHLAGHSMGADGGMSQVEQLQEIRDRISASLLWIWSGEFELCLYTLGYHLCFLRKGVIKSEPGHNSLYQIMVQRMSLRRGRPQCGDQLDKRWGHTVGRYVEKEQTDRINNWWYEREWRRSQDGAILHLPQWREGDSEVEDIWGWEWWVLLYSIWTQYTV